MEGYGKVTEYGSEVELWWVMQGYGGLWRVMEGYGGLWRVMEDYGVVRKGYSVVLDLLR